MERASVPCWRPASPAPSTPEPEDEVDEEAPPPSCQGAGTVEREGGRPAEHAWEDEEGGFIPDDDECSSVPLPAHGQEKTAEEEVQVPMIAIPPTARWAEWRVVPAGGFHAPEGSGEKPGGSAPEPAGRGGGAPGSAGSTDCIECGDAGCLIQFQETFGIHVCKACAAAQEKYKLLTKTTAKEEYLVTDSDLQSLGFISRKNPRKDAWGPMHLYLRAQVEEIAIVRHGNLAGMEAARTQRLADKYERLTKKKVKDSVLKRDASQLNPQEPVVLGEGSHGLSAACKIAVDERRPKKAGKTKKEAAPTSKKGGETKKKATAKQPAPVQIGRHTHVWGEEWYDDAKQTWRRKCTLCSSCVSFEKL